MAKEILQTLDQCEACEKFSTSKPPPKLVLPCEDDELYKKWEINIVGPMPKKKRYRFIIISVDFCTRWLLAHDSKDYDHIAISLFIGQEIKRKFGKPSIVMSDYRYNLSLMNSRPT